MNGEFEAKENFDSFSDLRFFEPVEGDVFILPDNHAVPVGKILQEGMIGNGGVDGVKAYYKDKEYGINSDGERLFFKASRSQLHGTSIRITEKDKEIYFNKVV